MSNISVIIRNRDEERYIGYAIQSVLDIFKNPEIIVIDNNSTDDSINIVKMFKKDESFNNGGNYTKLDIYNLDDYSPGKSLNFGVSKCSYENILILSAHSQIINLNLNKIISKLDDNAAVWGKQIPIYRGKKIIPRYIWDNFKNEDKVNYFCKNENRYFLHNAFCFYKKQNLIDNQFNEKLVGKEDRYWINDRIQNGQTSFYDSDMVCHHHYTTNGATWKGVG